MVATTGSKSERRLHRRLRETSSFDPHRRHGLEARSGVGAPVSVKAKRAEGLGALGRVEGIACLAVVLLSSEGGDSK